jgi:UDP-3-O-[3-hydroxymyristoyl] glucosamine N-acyltransferase
MAGPFTLAQIASSLGGRIAGDPEVLIRQVGTLEHAAADQLTFLANPRYKAKLAETRAGAVVLAPDAEALTTRPRIVCDNPYAYFARVSQLLNPTRVPVPGIDPSARVAGSAKLAASVRVDAGAVIGERVELAERVWIGAGSHVGDDSAIGCDTRLFPSVTVYHDSLIGQRVIVHSGVVIGADGFGLASEGGRWIKIPQIGRVRIGDDVEIGANTTIDRGAIDDTVIEEGVKLDNQIQIGHNVRVGAHTAIAGCTGVAGSTDIGRHCMIGGAAMILGHLRIADHTQISAATVISRSIRKPGTYTGIFPFDENASWARNTAFVRHLAALADRVRELEKRMRGKERND